MSGFTSMVSNFHFIDYSEHLAGVVRTIGRLPVVVLADVSVHCDIDDMRLVIGHRFVQWMFGHRGRITGGALALS